MGYIDLHVHSNASDGTLSPAQVVELAAREGLKAIALTDHDTVAGIREAKEAAEVLSPRVIVPMHYRLGQVGFAELAELEAFTSQYPPELVRRCPGNTLRLTPDMDRQVAVLALP